MSHYNQGNNTPAMMALTDEQVASYLQQHPDFFANKPDLLMDLQLRHPTNDSVISLIERQVSAMREKNMQIQRHLDSTLENARANDSLFEQTQYLILHLLEARQFNECLDSLFSNLESEFNIDYSQIILINSEKHHFPHLTNQKARTTERQQAVDSLASIIQNPHTICGQLSPQERQFIFQKQAADIGSAAVAALRVDNNLLGFLAVASRDPDYYRSNMSTLFLNFIAEVLSRLLAGYAIDQS